MTYLRHVNAVAVVLAALCAGCRQPSVGAERSSARAARDESNGPADGDWKRWLTPPPEDQPQPRFVCERPIHQTGPVWVGATTEFSWEVTNAGAAPLRLELWA